MLNISREVLMFKDLKTFCLFDRKETGFTYGCIFILNLWSILETGPKRLMLHGLFIWGSPVINWKYDEKNSVKLSENDTNVLMIWPITYWSSNIKIKFQFKFWGKLLVRSVALISVELWGRKSVGMDKKKLVCWRGFKATLHCTAQIN